MVEQADKGRAFRALHARKQTFILPNAWDAGSARVLESTGFPALATTSAGFANSRGQLDGQPGREAVLEHAAVLVGATDLPFSADLENGFGDSPETVAETIRAAARSKTIRVGAMLRCTSSRMPPSACAPPPKPRTTCLSHSR
jgi:2-methylisocitrate lyase-like PEP mutase family enzyme